MKNIKAIFFDLDGTLINSKKDITESVNDIRKDLNLGKLSEEEVMSHVGRGSNILLREVLPDNIDSEKYFDRFIEYYKKNSIKYSVFYEGAMELLQKLGGYKKVLITNKSYAVTREIINKFQLEKVFDIIYGGDSLPERKPSPYPLNEAMKNLSLTSEQVLYFGDSYPDYQASQSANVICVLASYGYGDKDALSDCKNAIFINTPLELLQVLNID